MKNTRRYYENTKNIAPHDNVKNIINKIDYKGKAIDFGCGAGRDTIFLIKNGWKVTAIDIENTEQLIKESLSESERNNLTFYNQKIGDVNLEKCDLFVANYSIPFIRKEIFKKVWENIINSINTDGYFVGNFFGIKDSWNIDNDKRLYFTQNDVQALFDDFEIISFEEIEKDGKAGINQIKHWHLFEVVARKK